MLDLAQELILIASNPEFSDDAALKEVAKAVPARSDSSTVVSLCWALLTVVAKSRSTSSLPPVSSIAWRTNAQLRRRRHAE
jgi:hypothetical protein